MRTIRTPGKRRTVLEAVSNGLTVAEAARLAGMSRRAVFEWRKADPVFAEEFEEAYDSGTDVFEAEARRRAFTESDTLLIFLLKQRAPARFNQKTITLAGDPANPIGIAHSEEIGSNVHFYMPSNGRDRPEAAEPEESEEPRTIEGTITGEEEAA